MRLLFIVLIVNIQLLTATCQVLENSVLIPAFPGAEGAGKYTTGGRDGIVYIVTNLNDEGPGSLRKGIRKKGPRTIVFAVCGNIHLKSPLDINNNDITIAGQSAPGYGICLRDYGLRVNADNVIIRYLRIRPGDALRVELDAVTGRRHKDIIIDHCSMSWSTDEVCSMYDNENFTLQWCIVSESLDQSYHSKGEHGYGGIWGGMKATFHHNLLAHHISRNPRLQGSRWHKNPAIERMEMVNNVVYNWRSKCIYAGEAGNYSIVANYFIPGPATKKSAAKSILEPYSPYSTFCFHDNYLEGNDEVNKNNLLGVMMVADSIPFYFKNKEMSISDYKMESAIEAYQHVLQNAGASYQRDSVDSRIVAETRERTSHFGKGGIINSQSEVGGWPDIGYVKAPIDSDMDGLPDKWEIDKGLNPKDKTDSLLKNLDINYTNLEIYLNSLL
ncbi:pectate lyase [Labilibaculum manganireducens]|uniref:pectate lyase family protein n=1 Tax=Labilibaculum manganireducens TaxID=1940525 RepID=UPI0029F4EB2C|nr:pectate lyase [Labilibaculum manganireducens]